MKQRQRTRFRLLMLLQIILLALSMVALAWTAVQTEYVAVPLVIGGIILLQVFGLLQFVESHVESLEEFFSAIDYEDFTRRFIEDDIDAELKEAFNRVLEHFQLARAERDLQANYLATVVKHVPVPFFAARQDGSLSLVNQPARRLTGMAALQHLDQLGELDAALPDLLRNIETGQQQLIQTRIRGVPVELRVTVAEIRMDGEIEYLFAIENLSVELTAREASAWRNLIRVLTHEIMNTLTPVTSLAQTTSTMLDRPEMAEDVRDAVATISRRSEGLMNFVARYRELLKVPSPDLGDVNIVEAFASVRSLLQDELADVTVEVDVTPESLIVMADAQLLDQVLLNLVRNALDAISRQESPKLSMSAYLEFGRVVLRIRDNGPGIPDDVVDQVFVPFFTTKRDGSGIGLSLCRQVMSAHGGDIAIESNADGTTVSLVF